MKIGTQTNSLTNHLYSRMTKGAPAPVAGLGASILMWSDRQACTVFRVIVIGKQTIIETRDDIAIRTDDKGMSESQKYDFKIDVNGYRRFFRQNKTGEWVEVRKNELTGRWINTTGPSLLIGQRRHYHDYSF